MISEEQLQEWDQQIDDHTLCWSWEEKAQLIAEVRRLNAQLSDSIAQGFYHGKTIMEDKVSQLEKEADYLAKKCEVMSKFAPLIPVSKDEFREEARKAVKE